MNNILNILRAELYKQLLNKIWFKLLLTIFVFIVMFMLRGLNKTIIPGIQIGTELYNPYIELIGPSVSLLSILILPTTLAIYIFINLKQNENYTNWIYGIVSQKPYKYVLSKLVAIILIWLYFLGSLCILFLATSFTIINFYPTYFTGYEINYQYLIIWFLKFYLSSLGGIALIFMANLFIKSKPVALIIPLFLPFLSLFFSGKSLFFPLSYAHQSAFWLTIKYGEHIKLKTSEMMRFNLGHIISGYEILSIMILAVVIIYSYLGQKAVSKYLTNKS